MRLMRFLAAMSLAASLSAVSAQTDPTVPYTPTPPAPTTEPGPEPAPGSEPSVPFTPAPPAAPQPAPPAPQPAPPAPQPAPPPPAPKPTPKPAPKPAVKPAVKPAPKPATAVVKPLQLRADLTETVIQNGELVTKTNTRAYTLPQKSVNLSRASGKLSSGIEAELTRIFRSLELNAENANWVFEQGAWIARQTTGRNVDEAASRGAVLEAVKFNKSLAVVKINTIQPRRNVFDWHQQGIRYYFGGGTSTFYGSAPFRVANIVNGALKLHRTTIRVGEVFDFNARVGSITAANGFVDGYIIKNGLLEKDVGGGICQVSTTMFRAAYESGLPIVQRNFHSYRVHYYDPVGYEATVFAPYKNLKFRNDTGGALYIQASWNTRRQWLTFSFFGSKPDRSASVGRPVVWKVIQPPATRWVADSAIRFGRVKMLSGPERGMNVRIDRVVRMNSGEIRRDSTFSYYVPWGAIYAVNPNDARVNVRPGYSVTGGSRSTGQRTSQTATRR